MTGTKLVATFLTEGVFQFISYPYKHSSVNAFLFSNTHFTVKFTGNGAGLLNTLRTGDADLRFYITTVQDG
jgi:hypothetical protein